jgi:hypothetical protein
MQGPYALLGINLGGVSKEVIGICMKLLESVWEVSMAVTAGGKFICRSLYLDFRTDSDIKVDLLDATLSVCPFCRGLFRDILPTAY